MHNAGMILELSIWIRGSILKKVVKSICGGGLLGREFAQRG